MVKMNFVPDLTTFVSNQTVCMSYSDSWSDYHCNTFYDTEDNYIICQCSFVHDPKFVGVKLNSSRPEGPRV